MTDKGNAAARQVNRNTVVLCVRKYLGFGLEAALGELPRSGKPRQVSDDAVAWMQNLACQKPKDPGHDHELWTYRWKYKIDDLKTTVWISSRFAALSEAMALLANGFCLRESRRRRIDVTALKGRMDVRRI